MEFPPVDVINATKTNKQREQVYAWSVIPWCSWSYITELAIAEMLCYTAVLQDVMTGLGEDLHDLEHPL